MCIRDRFYLGADIAVLSPANAQYVRNRWMQDTMFRMGQMSTHGRHVHVLVDGEYRGMYHLQERPTQSFLASYLPGDEDEYGYVNGGVTDDVDVWAQLKAAIPDWAAAQEWIDIDSLIDNQLLHFYAGNNWDWLAQRNWMAAGPRSSGRGGWKFFPWDSDLTFIHEDANNTDPTSLSRTNNPLNAPDGVFADLRIHPEFLARVNQRIKTHFFSNGVLTPENVIETYTQTANSIRVPLLIESARWGNIRNKNWNIENDWLPEFTRLTESFFVGRTQTVLNQLEAEGLYIP